jgi:WD40 repeat protein
LRLEGHKDFLWSAAYAPDGARIVTSGDDGSARVWDAKSGKELLRLEGHKRWELSAAYAPDGARIVTSGDDGAVRVWDAKIGRCELKMYGFTSGWGTIDARGRLRGEGDALEHFRFVESGPRDVDAPIWVAADLPELLLRD